MPQDKEIVMFKELTLKQKEQIFKEEHSENYITHSNFLLLKDTEHEKRVRNLRSEINWYNSLIASFGEQTQEDCKDEYGNIELKIIDPFIRELFDIIDDAGISEEIVRDYLADVVGLTNLDFDTDREYHECFNDSDIDYDSPFHDYDTEDFMDRSWYSLRELEPVDIRKITEYFRTKINPY